PELTEAVEEIEIASIVELPEDIDELSGWLHHDHGELSIAGKGPGSPDAPTMPDLTGGAGRVRSALAIVPKNPDIALPAPPAGPGAADVATPAPAADSLPAAPDEWARWEVLADEIR